MPTCTDASMMRRLWRLGVSATFARPSSRGRVSSSFSRSRESARGGSSSAHQCIRLRTISSVGKELNLLFSPLSLGRCFVSVRAEKKNARARAPERIERRRRERVSQIFSRARIVLRVRAILARVVVVVAARANYNKSRRRTLGEEPAKRESCAFP